MFLRLLAVTATLLLASCGSARLSAPDISPYRMEIQQGNFVSQEMVSQLKIGMSKEQARFVLGTPLITDSFHADRWDYIFRRQKSGSKQLEHHKLAVFFEDGKLARMESDVIAATGADEAGVRTPEAKPDVPAAKPEASAAKPEAPARPAPAAAPATKPAAPAAAEVPRPTPAATPEKSAATPENPAAAATTDGKPPEKKGWWDKIKDAVKF
jgi:outer membrane protein assembly factor BamE